MQDSIPQSRADAEFDRFESVMVRFPDGSGVEGVYDPAVEPENPEGVTWEAWQAFERDCAHLGKAVRP